MIHFTSFGRHWTDIQTKASIAERQPNQQDQKAPTTWSTSKREHSRVSRHQEMPHNSAIITIIRIITVLSRLEKKQAAAMVKRVGTISPSTILSLALPVLSSRGLMSTDNEYCCHRSSELPCCQESLDHNWQKERIRRLPKVWRRNLRYLRATMYK